MKNKMCAEFYRLTGITMGAVEANRRADGQPADGPVDVATERARADRQYQAYLAS